MSCLSRLTGSLAFGAAAFDEDDLWELWKAEQRLDLGIRAKHSALAKFERRERAILIGLNPDMKFENFKTFQNFSKVFFRFVFDVSFEVVKNSMFKNVKVAEQQNILLTKIQLLQRMF